MAQLKIDNRKLSIADISNIDNTDNTDNEAGTSFWNKGANETELDIKEKRNSNYENDLKKDKSRTEEAASSKIHKVEIKWNRKRKEKFCR